MALLHAIINSMMKLPIQIVLLEQNAGATIKVLTARILQIVLPIALQLVALTAKARGRHALQGNAVQD
jgi:hypothetical protein